MSKLNIWLIQIGEPLPIEDDVHKMRIAILADKLIERGHNILWWSSSFDHLKKKWIFQKDTELTIKPSLKIKTLKGIRYKKNVSLSRFIDHRIIARKFHHLALRVQKPDIIVASMPSYDLAYEGIKFAKKYNIPIVVDIRDPWPDIFLDLVPEKMRKIAKAILYSEFSKIKKITRHANGIIAVTNTFLKWGLNYAGRRKTWKDKVFYLGYNKVNFPLNIPKKLENLITILNKKFIVAYVGTFGSYHNPSIILDSALKFAKKDIYFVLAGDGEGFNKIKRESKKFKKVILTGWLNKEEITTLLRYAHLGVCPSTKIVDLFPNKAFSYLSAGLPVISAFQGDLKEIIEKHQIGFYYPPNDVDSFVKSIEILYNVPELYNKMSENALKVFDHMFEADKIYEEYAEHIERIVYDNYKKEI